MYSYMATYMYIHFICMMDLAKFLLKLCEIHILFPIAYQIL